MKTAIAAALFSLGILATSAQADWLLKQKTAAAGQEKDMTVKIKGDKVRSDVGDEMSVIIDADKGETLMVMHGQKKIMKMNPDAMKGLAGLAAKLTGNSDTGSGEGSLVATGQKEKIGEWDCEIYTWKGDQGKFWICKDFEHYEELNKLMEKMTNSMGMGGQRLMPKASETPGMVVKSEVTMMGQKSTSELTSIEETEFADADFEAPEGYETMGLPNIPGLNLPGGN